MSDEPHPIRMPQMGVSVEEGTVTVWHKSAGDAVAAEEPVCDVSTDKVDTEVVAPMAGTIVSIVAEVGDTVAVGEPLALMAPEGAEVSLADGPSPAGAGSAPSPDAPPAAVPVTVRPVAERTVTADITLVPHPQDFAAEAEAVVALAGAGPVASPVARRIASEHGVDLAALAGSGLKGRIRKTDVLTAIDAGSAPAPKKATAAAGRDGDLPRGYEDVPHRIVATTPTRRAIAEHMVRSRQTAAHMTTEVEVDMHQVAGVRKRINERVTSSDPAGPRLSYLPFIMRAACDALAEYPDLNATFDGDRLIQWTDVNMSVAIDTDRGLLAPVVQGCSKLGAAAISARIADLAARARDGELRPDDMRAGTFTISNPGSVGAVSAMAIINQPQVAILGTAAIVKRPSVVTLPDGSDAIAIRPIMLLALTFDHRAVDGAEATRCAVAIKQRLESWEEPAYG